MVEEGEGALRLALVVNSAAYGLGWETVTRGAGVVSKNGRPPCHNDWSLNAFCEDLRDQQPANMHFTRDACGSIWSFLSIYETLRGDTSKATRGSILYPRIDLPLNTTAVLN